MEVARSRARTLQCAVVVHLEANLWVHHLWISSQLCVLSGAVQYIDDVFARETYVLYIVFAGEYADPESAAPSTP